MNLLLLPTPQQIMLSGQNNTLADNRLIILDSPQPPALTFIAGQIQQALQQEAGISWQITAGQAISAEHIGLTLSIVPGAVQHPQGYQLTITPESIFIVAADAAGAFYAGQTLLQIVRQCQGSLPTLRIHDWPDFPNRGVMLDITRDKVPTMATLFGLIDKLAAWKINQLQLYTEHTFAYHNHPEVWAEASPLTGEEILTLDAYCQQRFIELVPNQNSFGHMHRWLKHDRYRPLAECPGGCDTDWGYYAEPFSLCPGDPGSLELLTGLYNELLPHFSSGQFNIGLDETVDLGRGRSQQAVAERGRGQVYLEFLLKIYHEVKARGRTMQFWGDIIMNYPELVAQLPHDAIALEWGYEADHPFAEHSAIFAASGIPFYVCPGTSSWNTIAGRSSNTLENLRNAAENGLKHGAVGYLNTDWGDRGHWQPLPVSYLGFAHGAALSWAYQANLGRDVAQTISRFAFQNDDGAMGRFVVDLGNAYLQPNVKIHNNSVLFRILQTPAPEIAQLKGLTPAGLQQTLAYLDGFSLPSANQLGGDDAALVRQEFSWVTDMLFHACQRGLWALAGQKDDGLRRQLAAEAEALINQHTQIWLARNRPGGLKDSQARLETMRQDYK